MRGSAILLTLAMLATCGCESKPDPDAGARLAERLRTLPERIRARRAADEQRWAEQAERRAK